MSRPMPLVQIPVGIVVARTKAASPWVDFVWRPVAALPGVPDARPWTPLDADGDTTRFYAGSAEVALYGSEAPRYAENLASATPSLWVVLRRTEGEPPYALFLVTADASEGEALTVGGDDLVEPVPMPETVHATITAFVAAHPVEEPFFKRKQQRADPEALARHDLVGRDRKP